MGKLDGIYAGEDDEVLSILAQPRLRTQGTELSFWTDTEGLLRANVWEKIGGFSQAYEGLVVIADPDVSLDKLSTLSEDVQKRYVHITMRKDLSKENSAALESRFPRKDVSGVVYLGREGLKGSGEEVRCLRCGYKFWFPSLGRNKYCDSCARDRGYNVLISFHGKNLWEVAYENTAEGIRQEPHRIIHTSEVEEARHEVPGTAFCNIL